jgi:glycosyltransferase involved in cell wall biosynthesis
VTREAPARVEALRAAGVPVYTASFSTLGRFATRRTIARAARACRPDVVQSWMGRASAAVPDTPEIRRAARVGWFGGYYDLKRFKRCQWYVGVTDDLSRHIVEAGAPAERVRTLHTFAPESDSPAIARAAHDTPPDAPLLVALARLHWKKGLDVLLDALVELPDAVLWIAGDGPLRADLESQVARLGLDRRVRFLGWVEDRMAALKSADVCAFPSRYEPFGTVMVEAWAARVPLVAAAAQGPAAYVRDGENGLLVPIDDKPALVEALRRAIDDPDLRRRLVEGGAATQARLFSRQAVVDQYLAFYREIA